jgi:hypothetical protein
MSVSRDNSAGHGGAPPVLVARGNVGRVGSIILLGALAILGGLILLQPG